MDNLGRLRWGVLALLVVLAVASAKWGLARNRDFAGFAVNLGTELAGAVVTYALFNLIIEQRERRAGEAEAMSEEKSSLITRMGSDEREVAVTAVNELRRQGWLTDGTLQKAKLRQASLGGADLWGANLRGANLWRSDLREANLRHSNLEWAFLVGANLEEAILGHANLKEAEIMHANLERVAMWGVNLEGAKLRHSNLRGAMLRDARVTARQLAEVQSLAGVRLPDGTELSENNWEAEFEVWREKQEGDDDDEQR